MNPKVADALERKYSPSSLDQVKDNVFRFAEDNTISFSQDFSFYKNIPSDVDFTAERLNETSTIFIGYGYGLNPGHAPSYGNGSIIVMNEHLPHDMRARIQRLPIRGFLGRG